MIAVIAELLDNSPATSPICTGPPAAGTRHCSMSPAAMTQGGTSESGLRVLPCARRLSPVVGRPAEAGPAVRCRRGPLIPPPKLRPAYEPRPRAPSSRDRATDWLRAYLAQRGPVLSTEVIADAAAAGFSCSTLRKARIDLNVRLQRVTGVGARHLWSPSSALGLP